MTDLNILSIRLNPSRKVACDSHNRPEWRMEQELRCLVAPFAEFEVIPAANQKIAGPMKIHKAKEVAVQ
jgi:hypothetical protein